MDSEGNPFRHRDRLLMGFAAHSNECQIVNAFTGPGLVLEGQLLGSHVDYAKTAARAR